MQSISKTTWRCVKILIFSVVAIFVIIGIIYFHNHYISKDISYWSDFGVFYWGVFSIIVSSLNLYFFISLTKSVSKIQEEWNYENYTGEQRRFLTEYRHKAINGITKTLSIFYSKVINHTQVNKNTIDFPFIHYEIIMFEEELRSLIVLNSYFFNNLLNHFEEIFIITKRIKNNIDNKKILDSDLNDLRSKFYLSISSLQKYNVDMFSSSSQNNSF